MLTALSSCNWGRFYSWGFDPLAEKREIPESIGQSLRCPACRSPLLQLKDRFECRGTSCGRLYPVVNRIPIFINEASSVFSISDIVKQPSPHSGSGATYPTSLRHRGYLRAMWKACRRFFPNVGKNYRAEQNYAQLASLVKGAGTRPRLLIIGGAIGGVGARAVLGDPTIDVVETDVAVRSRTMLVCDAHDLPFADTCFDGTIVQGVLEHVVDPHRCVAEIYRVLIDGGLVLAETPFMQPTHLAPYDFTRFTHLGHRRLFRHFEELSSGPTCGPGMALALAYSGFLTSFCRSRWMRRIMQHFSAFSAFWITYFDRYLLDKPGSYDTAAGFFFLGRKTVGYMLSDRELLTLYKGPQSRGIVHDATS